MHNQIGHVNLYINLGVVLLVLLLSTGRVVFIVSRGPAETTDPPESHASASAEQALSIGSPACRSFYDHVCLAETAAWRTNGDMDHSFSLVDQRNEVIVTQAITTLPFYWHCLAHASEYTTAARIPPVPTNVSIDDAIVDSLRRGLPFPVTVTIERAIHLPVYVIDLNVNEDLYYYARLQGIDDQSANNDDGDVLAMVRAMYETSQALRDSLERADSVSTMAEYIQSYSTLREAPLSNRWKAILETLFDPYFDGKEPQVDVWPTRVLVHTNYHERFYDELLSVYFAVSAADGNDASGLRLFQRGPLRYDMLLARPLLREPGDDDDDQQALGLDDVPTLKWYRHAKDFTGGRASSSRTPMKGLLLRATLDTPLGDVTTTARGPPRNITALCQAATRLVQRWEINEAFSGELDRIDGTKHGNRTHYVQGLAKRLRHSIAGIVGESERISTTTKLGIERKLENLVFYVLHAQPGPSPPIAERDSTSDTPWMDAIDQWLCDDKRRNYALVAQDFGQTRHRQHELMQATIPYQTVNAWYNPTQNTITVPPGILRYPIYHGGITNYDLSNIGMILAHEIGHAVDNSGRYFDEYGSWIAEQPGGIWAPEDETPLHARMDCLARDYGHPCGYAAYGTETAGEDIADQMGVRGAFRALLLDNDDLIDDEDKREFFRQYARLWCAREIPAHTCKQVHEDVHALPKHRVDKTLRQLAVFSATFNCTRTPPPLPLLTSETMVNPNRCVIY
jgi:hypothetical protein